MDRLIYSSWAARTLTATLLACLAMSLVGCRDTFIPNTDVEDTPQHRKIIDFCEDYRRAVERKNIARLIEIASPAYYEDGGNVDASDDIDYAGLRAYLANRFAAATGIRYEIRYRRIRRDKQGYVLVDYTYSGSYRVPTSEGEKWSSTVEENRLELEPHGESFRVVAGM
jgi:hypothetical protein